MRVDYLYRDSISQKSLKIAAAILPKQTTQQKKQEYRRNGMESTVWVIHLLQFVFVSPFQLGRQSPSQVLFEEPKLLTKFAGFTLHYEGKQCTISYETFVFCPQEYNPFKLSRLPLYIL